MRPIKVEFQAFGPYVNKESVDFEAISSKGLFLICGKTGIGKTMILDAMTFALYGKSSGHGRDDFASMRCTNADTDMNTYVMFRFENNGEYYSFERRLERKRLNFSPSYSLLKKDEDGIWRPLLENPKERDLNQKAKEIIGLEYEQFRQVIILPQGQFERLLTSNSDEKEKILTSIFGEDKWQAIAEKFYSKVEARKNEVKEIQAKIRNSLLEEQCDSIADLELVVSHKQNQLTELDDEFKANDYDKTIKEQQGILAIAQRFMDLHKAESKVEELTKQKDKRQEWEKKLNDAKRADKVKKLIDDEETAKKSLEKRENEEATAAKNAEKLSKESDKAHTDYEDHLAKEKDNEKQREDKISYENKREDYEGLDEIEKQLKEKKTVAAKAAKEEKVAKQNCDSYVEVISSLQKEYTDLQKEHEELLNSYLAGITGEIAKNLKEGEPCPVCGSTEHPHKAMITENSVTKAMVDSKKKETDAKYNELQEALSKQEEAKRIVENKHAEVEKANTDVTSTETYLQSRKKNLIESISTSLELEAAIRKLDESIREYDKKKKELLDVETKAKEALAGAKTKLEAAKKETKDAQTAYDEAKKAVKKGLSENDFKDEGEAKELMLLPDEQEEMANLIAGYDASVKTADENLASLIKELKEKEEPDRDKCQEIIDNATNAKMDYSEKKAVLTQEIERLKKKVSDLKSDGVGIEEKIRQADEDFVFAKKLRGDSGTGLQRYVLGIMFSSVVAAANQMLEKVHGGRYRLYRSDEKVQGTNKRGLDLKVFDKNSEGHDGRFVGTLSGGEKFLASLALSIGMSTVAQKSGIKIDALFIDEGFGSLDEESIGDAMTVLNSIQEANGLVGIISHVQILQDQIPSKLRVEQYEKGSRIIQTVG